MRIDLFCSEPHFLRHTLGIWLSLPVGWRGVAYLDGRWSARALEAGVPSDRVVIGSPPTNEGWPCLLASVNDLNACAPRPAIFVEHGAGQEVDTDHSSWAGGSGREGVMLYIAPSEHVAQRNAERYPHTPTAVVGCPALDRWLAPGAVRAATLSSTSTVAVTWHWRCQVGPEQHGTFDHWAPALPKLARTFKVIGHAHPREWGIVAGHYEEFGIEPVADWEEVLDRANVLCFDNSSAGAEAAAVGIPVVVLNAPWYRDGIKLWWRFGYHQDIGLNCDTLDALVDTVAAALTDPPEAQEGRRRAVEAIYAHTDGRSAQRAADAIVAHLGD